jgi:hypothetical protein
MKNAIISLSFYGLFFGVIGLGIYITGTGWPLWALVFTPNIKIKSK